MWRCTTPSSYIPFSSTSLLDYKKSNAQKEHMALTFILHTILINSWIVCFMCTFSWILISFNLVANLFQLPGCKTLTQKNCDVRKTEFQQCLHILSFHKGRNSKLPHSSMQSRRKFEPLLQRSHPCYVHVGKNVLCSSVYDDTDAHGILWICETPGGPTNHLS